MQNKTIKKLIRKKIIDWIASINDEKLRKRVEDNVIVTGGSIASMAMGDPVNDYDVYFRDKKTTKKVAEYYAGLANNEQGRSSDNCDLITVGDEVKKNIKGVTEDRVTILVPSSGIASSEEEYVMSADGTEGIGEEDTNKYNIQWLSENAITLTNKLQIVIRFSGDPEEIHKNFDFKHAMCWYDFRNDALNIPIESARSMMSKTLYYSGSLYPICSLFRMRKFINRGWNISAGEIMKIAFQISEIDLSDKEVLREQLTGVDQLYFDQLYYALAEQDSDKINSSYVCTIIDKIFGDCEC